MWPGRGPRTGPQDRAVAIFGWDYSIEADPAPGAPGTLSPASSWNSVLGEGCCVDRPQGPNGLMPEDLSERPGLGRTGGGGGGGGGRGATSHVSNSQPCASTESDHRLPLFRSLDLGSVPERSV